MYHIEPVIVPERFSIVRHSYIISLSIKTCLDKTNAFFNSKANAIYLHPLIFYESKMKIKVTLSWAFF